MMNDEEMTLLTETVSDNKSAAKPKRKRTGEEKIAVLLEQKNKLNSALADNREKGNKLSKQLARNAAEIREYRIKELEAICKERNFDYGDIVSLVRSIPDKVALEKLISRK